MQYVTKEILNKIYKKRDVWSHKGQHGKLIVISGSERHTGSPSFVGMSAYRAGCDLVYVIAPERAANVVASFSPNLITEPLEGSKLTTNHIGKILSLIETVRATAVVIGPGLWRDRETFDAIIKLIENINLPMVIDADAIRAIGTDKKILKDKNAVLTPHSDEFRELTGVELTTVLEERIKKVEYQAKKINTTILLKGHVDVISNGENTFLNRTGSPLLTKGGCGDTLTGVCGAILARGINVLTAACAAAYVNGRAGEIVAKKYGEGLVATDLINHIHEAIR